MLATQTPLSIIITFTKGNILKFLTPPPKKKPKQNKTNKQAKSNKNENNNGININDKFSEYEQVLFSYTFLFL